jgi:predicted HicB family RNase H-like nuclease
MRLRHMADRKQLNVPVDPELAEAVRRAAHRAYRSKASWIRDVLRQAAAA